MSFASDSSYTSKLHTDLYWANNIIHTQTNKQTHQQTPFRQVDNLINDTFHDPKLNVKGFFLPDPRSRPLANVNEPVLSHVLDLKFPRGQLLVDVGLIKFVKQIVKNVSHFLLYGQLSQFSLPRSLLLGLDSDLSSIVITPFCVVTYEKFAARS